MSQPLSGIYSFLYSTLYQKVCSNRVPFSAHTIVNLDTAFSGHRPIEQPKSKRARLSDFLLAYCYLVPLLIDFQLAEPLHLGLLRMNTCLNQCFYKTKL